MYPLYVALTVLPYVPLQATRGALTRPLTAPGLGVCEWSPEGLYDKSVSWIPTTDEMLKLLKNRMN